MSHKKSNFNTKPTLEELAEVYELARNIMRSGSKVSHNELIVARHFIEKANFTNSRRQISKRECDKIINIAQTNSMKKST